MKLIKILFYPVKKYIQTVILKLKFYDSKINTNNIHNSEIGTDCSINTNTVVFNSVIGDYSYLNYNSIVENCVIGKFVSIGSFCEIGAYCHPTNFISTSPKIYGSGSILPIKDKKSISVRNRKTIIGNDVWIGSNVVILEGIKIGNGAIIAAGAVVTKDVNDYEVVGGVPATVLKNRFDKNIVKKINNLEWWNLNSKTELTELANMREDFYKYL